MSAEFLRQIQVIPADDAILDEPFAGFGHLLVFLLRLAVAAAEHGLMAAIIDLDPQANAANWKDRRAAENPAVVSSPPSRVRQTLETAKQHGADFIVIDSPGKADSTSIIAASFADLVYVPVEPHMSNLETLPGVHNLLQATQNKTPPVFVLVNKMHPSATTQAEAVKRSIAEIYPFSVCPHQIDRLGAAIKANPKADQPDTDPPPAGKIVQLPLWPEPVRGTPNSFLRSTLCALCGNPREGEKAPQKAASCFHARGHSPLHRPTIRSVRPGCVGTSDSSRPLSSHWERLLFHRICLSQSPGAQYRKRRIPMVDEAIERDRKSVV